MEAFNKLGIPLEEQSRLAGVAVDAVLDSSSVATTYQETLEKAGVIFCSMSEAIRKHPDLVQKYLGSVVPYADNFYAAPEFCRVQRRFLCLYTQGRPVPYGVDDLLPHQRPGHRAV